MNVLDKTYSQELDSKDSLAKYRKDFHIPVFSGKQALYFTGNSLGLMPKLAEKYMTEELEDWKKWGVEGHVHARRPWMPYHEFFSESLAKIVGGKPEEVVVMGSLTNNLHLLMVSFFRPKFVSLFLEILSTRLSFRLPIHLDIQHTVHQGNDNPWLASI